MVGGRDRSAGGTWMALGPHGVVAAVLNRPGSLGPEPRKRSRGILPLNASAARSARDAADAMEQADAGGWRPFNLVTADAREAFFLRGLGQGRPQRVMLPEGISMVTAQDPNDPTSPRIQRHLPRFRAAQTPAPDRDDWSEWETLLADGGHGPDRIAEALCVPPVRGFGTVCSSLLALGAAGQRIWRFCPAPPSQAPFEEVALPPA